MSVEFPVIGDVAILEPTLSQPEHTYHHRLLHSSGNRYGNILEMAANSYFTSMLLKVLRAVLLLLH